MTFADFKPGGYAFGEILPSADMNVLAADHPLALDGRDGGAYAPTSQIAIAGSGLACTGKFDVTDTLGAVQISALTVPTGGAGLTCTGEFNVTDTVGSVSINDLTVVSGGAGFDCTGKFDVTDTTGTVSIGATTANSLTVTTTTALDTVPTISSTTVTRVQPLVNVHPSDGWLRVSTDLRIPQNLVSGNFLSPISNLADNSTLTEVRFWFIGSMASLPATLQTCEIGYVDNSGIEQSPTPQAVLDTSANVGAYNSHHSVTVTLDTPLTIDQSAAITVFARMVGNIDGNTGLELTRIEADFVTTTLSPGG